ncbi:hypothetical protein SBA3_3030016 [Candidatus Sulfopaludibacter sp. SbA3]|nr:hypothetical protein SBA3_3030016 [Candidatus Sulfopaludibacter sp. SbA3]
MVDGWYFWYDVQRRINKLRVINNLPQPNSPRLHHLRINDLQVSSTILESMTYRYFGRN